MSDNPFLLPPGGATPPPAPRTPDVAPVPDPSHYIAVPASVESVTHRIQRPAPEPEPVVAETVAPEPAAVEPAPVSEETQLALPVVRAWALVLPDGARVSLDGPLLLGRDPAGIPDRPDAALRALADDAKTVSKTHAMLEPTPEGIRVRELHSTNGIAIDTAGSRQLLVAGGEAVAPLGSTILLGSFAIEVATG